MKCDKHIWDTDDKEWCWKCEELTMNENKKKYINTNMERLDLKHFKTQLDSNMIVPDELYYLLQEELGDGNLTLTLMSHNIEDDLPDYEYVNNNTKTSYPIVKKH